MKNISRSLKRNISEIKEKKNNLIIEHSIVRSRLEFVLEQEYKNDNAKFIAILEEMINLEEQGYNLSLINEEGFDFFSMLGRIFGGSFGSIWQVLGEKMADGIAKKLGIDTANWVYNVIVSWFTSMNWKEYGKLFTDCKFVTNGISDAVIEGTLRQMQKENNVGEGVSGVLLDALRNSIMKEFAESKDSLIQKLEDIIGGIICGSISGWKSKIANITSK
jgi:regulator of replication initiation timing